MTCLVDRYREHLQRGQHDKTENVGAIDGDQLVRRYAGLLEPEHQPVEGKERKERSPDAREREPTDDPIDAIHEGVGVRPSRDVPDDEPAQPHRRQCQRVVFHRDRAQLFVDEWRFLAEESVRVHRGGQPREAFEREGAGPLEMVDEDLLHGAAPIHELIERDVLGLEAQIATRAFVAARILDHGISTAAAPTQVRAFDVRTWRRHERRIVQTTTEDLPDVDHCPSPAVRLRLRPHEELVERRQASGRRISTGSRPDRTRGMARDYRISLSTERSQAARS